MANKVVLWFRALRDGLYAYDVVGYGVPTVLILATFLAYRGKGKGRNGD